MARAGAEHREARKIERGTMRTGELRRIFCTAWMVVMALLIASSMRAQQATGAITGAVTDPSGAPVAGASVTVTDTERGTSLKAQTNTDGVYNFPQLQIGQYNVRVEATGFQTSLANNVGLALNQTAKLDFAMTIGQVSQTVDVSETIQLLQTCLLYTSRCV